MQAQLVVEQTLISNRFLAHLCSRIVWLTRKEEGLMRCQASSAKPRLNATHRIEAVIWTEATMWGLWSWGWALTKLSHRCCRCKMIVNQKVAIFLARWSRASNAREPNSILRVEIVRHAKEQVVYHWKDSTVFLVLSNKSFQHSWKTACARFSKSMPRIKNLNLRFFCRKLGKVRKKRCPSMLDSLVKPFLISRSSIPAINSQRSGLSRTLDPGNGHQKWG